MRWLTVFLVSVFFLGRVDRAWSDIPPPPPPKGQKYVNIEHEVILTKDAQNLKGYVFLEQVSGFGTGVKGRLLELGATKATAITKGGRRIGVGLFAVSEKIAKEYKNPDDLAKAIFDNKIEGLHPLFFDPTTTISTTDKRDTVKWTHTISAIKADGSFEVKTAGDGANQKLSPTNADDTNSTRFVIAGLAATLAFAFAGLWLVRRR